MRYFIEVSYKGTHYSGFQVQENAVTIQGEIENTLHTILKTEIKLTGSSRTDAGVHALQNFFHFDTDIELPQSLAYGANAILPADITIKNIYKVADGAHSRFDALSREYAYYITVHKNPFTTETAYHCPYKLDRNILNETAAHFLTQNNFYAFSKTNTQVNNFICTLYESYWEEKDGLLIYHIKGNRFLRGMVRALVGTMLAAARGKLSPEDFNSLFTIEKKCGQSVPALGLHLVEVLF